jgi:hypothetical protein
MLPSSVLKINKIIGRVYDGNFIIIIIIITYLLTYLLT